MKHLRDVMTRKVISLRADMSVREAARILTGHGISGAPVLDARGHIAGVLSVHDVAAALASGEPAAPALLHEERAEDPLRVAEVMSLAVHRLPEDATLLEATSTILLHRIHRVIVVDGRRLTGVLTTFDLLGALRSLLDGSSTLRVSEVMHRDPVVVEAELPTGDLARLLVEHGISGAPVVDADGLVIGVVSLTDLAVSAGWAGEHSRRPASYLHDTWTDPERVAEWLAQAQLRTGCVGDIMSPFALGVDEDAPVLDVVELLHSQRIHRAVVTRGRQVRGIVSTMDLVKLLQQVLLG